MKNYQKRLNISRPREQYRLATPQTEEGEHASGKPSGRFFRVQKNLQSRNFS